MTRCLKIVTLLASLELAALATGAFAVTHSVWLPIDSNSYINLRYNGYPESTFNNPELADLPEDAEIFMSELHIQGGLFRQLGPNDSTFMTRLIYGWVTFDYGGESATTPEDRFDKGINIEWEAAYRWWKNETWGLQASATPGLAANRIAAESSNDFIFSAGLWGMYDHGDWALGAGAVRTYIYGAPMFLPGLILEYDGDPVNIAVNLPSLAWIRYAVGWNIDLDLVYEVWGMRYAENQDRAPELQDPFAGYSITTIGGGVGYTFDKRLHLFFEGGYMTNRRLRLMDDDAVITNFDLEDGPYIRAFLTFGGDL